MQRRAWYHWEGLPQILEKKQRHIWLLCCYCAALRFFYFILSARWRKERKKPTFFFGGKSWKNFSQCFFFLRDEMGQKRCRPTQCQGNEKKKKKKTHLQTVSGNRKKKLSKGTKSFPFFWSVQLWRVHCRLYCTVRVCVILWRVRRGEKKTQDFCIYWNLYGKCGGLQEEQCSYYYYYIRLGLDCIQSPIYLSLVVVVVFFLSFFLVLFRCCTDSIQTNFFLFHFISFFFCVSKKQGRGRGGKNWAWMEDIYSIWMCVPLKAKAVIGPMMDGHVQRV